MKANEITEAALKALKREDNPAGILIEAVIEKELLKYETLLKDIKRELYGEHWAENLIERINNTLQYE